MKIIFNTMIIFLFSSLVFAQNNEKNIIIHYTDLHKNVRIYGANIENLNHDLTINTNKKDILQTIDNHTVNIFVRGKPVITYKKTTIEVHAGTLFLNGKGIGFEDNANIVGDLSSLNN